MPSHSCLSLSISTCSSTDWLWCHVNEKKTSYLYLLRVTREFSIFNLSFVSNRSSFISIGCYIFIFSFVLIGKRQYVMISIDISRVCVRVWRLTYFVSYLFLFITILVEPLNSYSKSSHDIAGIILGLVWLFWHQFIRVVFCCFYFFWCCDLIDDWVWLPPSSCRLRYLSSLFL